jgi:pyruvate,water dikinase
MVVESYEEDFSVVWSDPRHAEESWVLDRLHWPQAMAPLYQAVHQRIMAVAFEIPSIFVNGYGFAKDFGPPPATPDVNERGPIPVWEEDYLPIIKRGVERLRSSDYDALTAADLVERMPGYFDDIARLFRYTTVVIFAFLRPTALLVSWLEEQLGEEDGAHLAAGLLQGYENETSAAGQGLSDLTRLAREMPAVAAALEKGSFQGIDDLGMDGIDALEGGREFLNALGAYLDAYGWRADAWGFAHHPTALEDPAGVLRLIGRYLAEPERSPDVALQRSRGQREAALAEIEARLPAEKLPQFYELRDAAAGHLAISEARAFWQLAIIACMRWPALALGRKLAAEGVIEEPNDVFFFYEHELEAAAKPDRSSLIDVVADRKELLARQEKLMPPTFLGTAPSMSKAPPDMRSAMRHFRGWGVEPSKEPNVLKGLGASRGTARGVARVITGLHEAQRLAPGDILVCRTTAPPWTPLFTIAGAVVTDSGGLLSHSAICAREYGIPCVVATQDATVRIQDGALLSVDGTKGTVTIEDGPRLTL